MYVVVFAGLYMSLCVFVCAGIHPSGAAANQLTKSSIKKALIPAAAVHLLRRLTVDKAYRQFVN